MSHPLARGGLAVLLATSLWAGSLLSETAWAAGVGQAGRAAGALGDAQARAKALRLAVDALQTKAELATEAYNAAYVALGQAETANLVAQAALDRATSTAGSAGRTAGRRVRALYMSGGAPALYATVLQGGDINDIFERLASVRAVVGGDRLAADAAQQSVARQAAAQAHLAALADQQTRLEAAVAGQADQVRSLLADAAALLTAADARVRQIADAQRQAAEAAQASAAAAALARAQLQAGLPGGTVTPPTVQAGLAIAEAERHLGQPYLWGGTGPAAYDCSGLTLTAYRAAGISLPRTAAEQYLAGQPVALGQLAPGDLLFWATDPSVEASIHHVAIYLGNGQMIAAPHTGAFVRIQPVYLDGFYGAVRLAPVPGGSGSATATPLGTVAGPAVTGPAVAGPAVAAR